MVLYTHDLEVGYVGRYLFQSMFKLHALCDIPELPSLFVEKVGLINLVRNGLLKTLRRKVFAFLRERSHGEILSVRENEALASQKDKNFERVTLINGNIEEQSAHKVQGIDSHAPTGTL